MAGENFGEFGESEAIRQSFTHPNLHFKKLRIVDYQKIHRAKIHAVHTMSILKYFRPLREKPDPSAPLRETVRPTAIVEANVKVSEALNEAELKTEKCKPGLWNALISDASAEVWLVVGHVVPENLDPYSMAKLLY